MQKLLEKSTEHYKYAVLQLKLTESSEVVVSQDSVAHVCGLYPFGFLVLFRF